MQRRGQLRNITVDIEGSLLFMTSPEPRTQVNQGDTLNISVEAEHAKTLDFYYKNSNGSWVLIGSGTQTGIIWNYTGWQPSVPATAIKAIATYSDASTKEVENSLLSIALKDTFTDTNGVLISNHNPDENLGGDWIPGSGNWRIENNQLRLDNADSNKYALTYDLGTPNAIMKLKIPNTFTNYTYQAVLRYVDVNNTILVLFHEDNQISIGETVNGTFTFLSNKGEPYTTGELIEIRLIDNLINIIRANKPVLTVEVSAHPTATKYGLARGGANYQVNFDDVELIPISLPPLNNSVSYTATKNGSLILTPNFLGTDDQTGLAGAEFYKIGTTNYMVHAVRNAGGEFAGLTYATSPENDPHNWTRHNALILTADTASGEEIADCSMYWDGSNIHLLYSNRNTGVINYAKGADIENLIKQGTVLDFTAQGIYARHPSIVFKDGLFYVYLDIRRFQSAGEFGEIAVVSGTGLTSLSGYKEVLSNLGYKFEQCDVGSPSVRYNSTNGYFEMLFVGYPGGGTPYYHEIGLAINKNPLGKFERVSSTPLIARGVTGIDTIQAIDPAWFPDGDIVYYTADASETGNIYDGITYAELT